MQIDGHFTYLWQLDSVASDGIILELGKHKGLELTKLFETGESTPPFLKSFPGIMQSANCGLQHLRMYIAQMRELLLRFGQVVLLTVVGRKWLVSRNDVFLLLGASIYRTLTRSNPVFEFAHARSYTRLCTSQATTAVQSAARHLDRFGRCSSWSA